MPLALFFATPLNSNTVRVIFAEEPRHVSQLGATDSLRRDNWTLELVDNGGDLLVVEPSIEVVENALPQPSIVTGLPDLPWSVDLRTDRRLIEKATYRIIANTDIVSADGSLTVPPDPDDRAEFPGIHVSRDNVRRSPTEVRNAGVDLRYDFFEGRYLLDPKDDLDVHDGLEFLKKRVIRRLITTPGGFYHLETYGVGLESKQVFSSLSTAELQVKIIQQLKLEEEIVQVAVDVVFEAGILFVGIRARTRQRGALILNLQVPEDGEVVVL